MHDGEEIYVINQRHVWPHRLSVDKLQLSLEPKGENFKNFTNDENLHVMAHMTHTLSCCSPGLSLHFRVRNEF